MKKEKVEIKDKYALTYEEAAAYFGIGVNKLREVCVEHPELTLQIGVRRIIKKEMFAKYLDEEDEI